MDYEKLKIANELALSHATKNDTCTSITMVARFVADEEIELDFSFASGCDWKEINTSCLDKLIAKLKELTEPEPRYKVGQEVWVMHQGHGLGRVIADIRNGKYYLTDELGFVEESDLYSSKESLIKAQIKYWSDMLPQCEHEADITLTTPDNALLMKCKKCRKFYQ